MPGATSRFAKNPDTDHCVELGSIDIVPCDPGDIILIQGPGAGGYGNPLDRPANDVLTDVRRGLVSAARAKSDYGVVIGDDLVIDAALTVGAATQTVEVSASALTLQTESATVQKLVTREQIDALEINGRNPIFMANLVPGTRGGTLANLSFNFSQGPSNINGARTPETDKRPGRERARCRPRTRSRRVPGRAHRSSARAAQCARLHARLRADNPRASAVGRFAQSVGS